MYSDSEIGRLLDKCKKGDEQAWSQLVDRFSNLVYSVPARMKLSTDDCADVFQNTFLALSKGIERIHHAVALPRWLAVTASREAIRLRRTSGRYSNESSFEEMDLDALIADEEESAEARAVKSVEADTLRAAVAKLPEKCRALLELLFLGDEISYAEISKRTGVPVGAIGPTRARCLDKLRKKLADIGFFDEESVSSEVAWGS
ncbi:MAG: sigma-70 family RNA polymerase sigma factor [Armatimonadota bacterium]|nr:sigma-70 family RNA polymerase sigma factor [Armatimonadota bacterium]